MSGLIGVLDSGVGGLSVLSELVNVMPDKKYIYFGDTKNMPYGTKTPEEIHLFTKNILNFFLNHGVKNVVFACNTTSAVAYDNLKKEFLNKLNIFPLIQLAARPAVENLKDNDTIAVLATKATINSKKYDEEIHKINPKINVLGVDCTGFVEIVENNGIKRYRTKGDNNKKEDRDLVKYSQIEGKYEFRIKGFGKFIEILKNKITLVILLIILVLVSAMQVRLNKKKLERKEKWYKYNLEHRKKVL